MGFLKKLGKYSVLKESTKYTDEFHKKVKAEFVIYIHVLQKKNK